MGLVAGGLTSALLQEPVGSPCEVRAMPSVVTRNAKLEREPLQNLHRPCGHILDHSRNYYCNRFSQSG